ncbi:MAG: glycosyltransferase family 39 protein [Gammaproteobacteria bacterium]
MTPRPTQASRRDFVLMLLFGVIVLASGLGLRDPWAPDEPRFALAARDMLLSGDWLVPRVGGDLYPDKPPLFMWLIAVGTWFSGSLRIGFMLPSMLASFGVLCLVTDLARRLWDRNTAIAAGLVLLCTVQFPLQAHTAQIDATLTFLTTLGLYGLLRHLLLGPAWGWYLLGWAAAGLGVITKGVGILPLLVLLPWIWARRRQWTSSPEGSGWHWLGGPVCMLLAIGVWLVPMLIHTWGSLDPDLAAYRDNILMKQTMERYARSWGHIQPPWYFITHVIPFLWLPTILLLPWLSGRWRQALRARSMPVFLLLAWIGLVLLFFSATPGKRGVYLLPAVPAFALLVAPWARELCERRGVRRLALAFTSVVTLLCAGLAAFPLQESFIDTAAERDALRLLFAGWAVIGAVSLLVFGLARAHFGVVTMMAALMIGYGAVLFPLANDLRSGGNIPQAAEALLGPDETLGLVRWKEQFLLHARRPLVHFGYRRSVEAEEMADALSWLKQQPGRALVLREADLLPCFLPERAMALGVAHRRAWVLVRGDAESGDCQAPATPVYHRQYRPADQYLLSQVTAVSEPAAQKSGPR